MCGRFTLTVPLDDLRRRFSASAEAFLEDRPRFNIAPTQPIPVIRQEDEGRMIREMRWGLIPRWAKEASIGQRMINARRETLTEKPSFRPLLYRHRCLIPADGYYEWAKTETGKKQPYRIVIGDGELFAFAGLWDRWFSPDGKAVDSFTVITTQANEKLSRIHHRMPVILPRSAEAIWLDPEVKSPKLLQELLVPYPDDLTRYYPVSTLVNSPRNDSRACIRPVEGGDP